MDGIVTLAERQRRQLDAMRAAVVSLDAALADYARAHGGRFIRYGSSAKGLLHGGSDIDLIADFGGYSDSSKACSAAEALCDSLHLLADARPIDWASEQLVARALSEGIVLS